MRQHFGRIVVVTFFTIPVASASPEDRRDVSVLNWPVPARGAASPLAPLSVISGGAPFVAVTPCRLADTRVGSGFTGPYGPPMLAAGTTRSFPVAGQCSVPASGVTAVSFNFTVTNALGAGDLRVFPQGGATPLVSTLNYGAGQTIPNAAIVSLGGGEIAVLPDVSGTDLIIDINGYFGSAMDTGRNLAIDTSVAGGAGLLVTNSGAGPASYAVHGIKTVSGGASTAGVFGQDVVGFGNGVYGTSLTGIGVHGYTSIGYAVLGQAVDPGGTAVAGSAGPLGLAGHFTGNVQVTGTVTKGGGAFKIDHPLDPENKYLSHSFVESPDMMDVYDGLVLLDGTGAAVVELPAWFEALNRDFRYQLTCIGRFAPVYVAEKVSSNRFRIAGGHPGLEVSWQITGIRHDAFANAHRIVVEEEKARNEKGLFLHPSAFGEPDEKQIGILPPAR